MLLVNRSQPFFPYQNPLEIKTMTMRVENYKLPTDKILRAQDQGGNSALPLFQMDLLNKVPQAPATAALTDLVITNGGAQKPVERDHKGSDFFFKHQGHYKIGYWHHNGHDTIVCGSSDLPGEQNLDF